MNLMTNTDRENVIVLTCPNFFIIGVERIKIGIPDPPPTVIVIPIKRLSAPKS